MNTYSCTVLTQYDLSRKSFAYNLTKSVAAGFVSTLRGRLKGLIGLLEKNLVS